MMMMGTCSLPIRDYNGYSLTDSEMLSYHKGCIFQDTWRSGRRTDGGWHRPGEHRQGHARSVEGHEPPGRWKGPGPDPESTGPTGQTQENQQVRLGYMVVATQHSMINEGKPFVLDEVSVCGRVLSTFLGSGVDTKGLFLLEIFGSF